MNDLWSSYRDGSCSLPTSLALGLGAGVVARLLGFLLLRPLIQAFARKDSPYQRATKALRGLDLAFPARP